MDGQKKNVNSYADLSSDQLRKLLEERDETIKSIDEMIKSIEMIKEDTVQKLLEKEKLPDMTPNSACLPSIIKNETARKNTLQRRGGEQLAVKTHDVAKIRTRKIEPSLLEFAPNDMREEKQLIKSSLLFNFNHYRKRKFPHHNETSPQDYVSYLLRDVITCCGIDAEVLKEATVFSLRPHLVVVKYQGRILIAVEIKNPGGNTSIFEAEETAGQVYDYLKGLRKYGNDAPIVILSNYREMVICCLTEDEKSVMTLIKETNEAYKAKQDRIAPKQATPSPEKPAASPGKPKGYFIWLPPVAGLYTAEDMVVAEQDDDDDDESPANGVRPQDTDDNTFDYKERFVTYSQVFTLKNAFHALTLAVEAAALAIDKDATDFELPAHGSSMNEELCALGKNSFDWKRFNVTITYGKVPRLPENFSIGVLASIGCGSTGKCLLCCTTTGVTFVAKLFLPEPSFHYCEKDCEKEIAQSLSAKQAEAKEECKRWEELYKEYKMFCKTCQLNDIPALIMPYFAPLQKKERKMYLPQVQTLLQNFANSGYTYEENSDVRWSHVGRRNNNSGGYDLVLLDLGSLTEIGKNGATERVASIVQRLKDRMGDDCVSPASAPPLVGRLPAVGKVECPTTPACQPANESWPTYTELTKKGVKRSRS